MEVDVQSLNTNNAELQGGVIGLTGTDIRISCEKIKFAHRTGAVETTHPTYNDFSSGAGSVSADNYPVFIGTQHVNSPISFVGEYIGPEPAGVLTAMEAGVALAVLVQLDIGIVLDGELLILSADVTEERQENKVDLAVHGIFTGQIVGDQSGSRTRSNVLTLDRKIGSSYTIDVQDVTGASATRPWVARGCANQNVSLAAMCDLAIEKAGGIDSLYPGRPSLQLLSATGVWANGGQSKDVIVGHLHYGQGPLSMCNKGIRVMSAWIDQKRRQPTAVGSSSSSGINACDIISGFGLSVSSYVKLRKGYKVYLIPCVWDTQPDESAYLNTINADVFTIAGQVRGAYTVRWDPLEGVQQIRRPDGTTKWTGWIQISVKPDGWTDHKIHCVATVKLPPVGGQTEGGAAAVYGWLQVYMYPTGDFPTLAEFCPKCAANYS